MAENKLTIETLSLGTDRSSDLNNKQKSQNEYKNLFDKTVPLSPYSYLQKFNVLVNRQNYQLAKIKLKGEVGALDLLPQPLEKIAIPEFFLKKHELRLNNQSLQAIQSSKTHSLKRKRLVKPKDEDPLDFGKSVDQLRKIEKESRPNQLELGSHLLDCSILSSFY